jgi:hypothetical protein
MTTAQPLLFQSPDILIFHSFVLLCSHSAQVVEDWKGTFQSLLEEYAYWVDEAWVRAVTLCRNKLRQMIPVL